MCLLRSPVSLTVELANQILEKDQRPIDETRFTCNALQVRDSGNLFPNKTIYYACCNKHAVELTFLILILILTRPKVEERAHDFSNFAPIRFQSS